MLRFRQEQNRFSIWYSLAQELCQCTSSGICFTIEQNISYSKNLESRLLSLKKCVSVWSSEDLTLYDKIINPVKSLALSKFTFVAAVLPTPQDFIKSVNKQIVDFIWSHKNPKVKKATMMGEKRGGFRYARF